MRLFGGLVVKPIICTKNVRYNKMLVNFKLIDIIYSPVLWIDAQNYLHLKNLGMQTTTMVNEGISYLWK